MRFLRLDLPGMTVLIRPPLSQARNASVSYLLSAVGSAIPGMVQTCFGHSGVGSVAGREDEYPRSTLFVDNRVDLGVSADFGDAYCVRLGPLSPLAQRWIFIWLMSGATCPGVSGLPATAANIACQFRAAPAESIVSRLVRLVLLGQSFQRHLTRCTCIMPLKIGRSSFRSGPR
jgi:hypothetical protein